MCGQILNNTLDYQLILCNLQDCFVPTMCVNGGDMTEKYCLGMASEDHRIRIHC